VAEGVADAFERGFTAKMQALKVGDPLDPATEVGPLATRATLTDLDDQVRRSIAAGARVLAGGHALERPGNYYAPTVLTDIKPGSPAYAEELFGPVAALFRVRDAGEAIRLANDTPFGLGASVWTRSIDQAHWFIRNLKAGTVWVNTHTVLDLAVPFGGVKQSGMGHELGEEAIKHHTHLKAAFISLRDP
jgi:NAD-dependent aldehyde dehydrogenases